MTKYLLSVLTLASLATPAFAAEVPMFNPSAAQITANVVAKQQSISNSASSWQVYSGNQRLLSQAQDVAKMNGITLEAAMKRVKRGWTSANGYVGVSPIWPVNQMVFDPAYGAWRNAFSLSFYAGYDTLTGQHKMTSTQRSEVRDDNYWYCSAGQHYTFGETESGCK